MKDIHKRDIIEDKLSISYEHESQWFDSEGIAHQDEAAAAVMLYTRCCTNNHEHIELNKEQARLLGQWLTEFANGVYDE